MQMQTKRGWLPFLAAVAMAAVPLSSARSQLSTDNLVRWASARPGTLAVEFNEIRIGGQLVGCDLNFVQAVTDVVYAQGAPVLIHGGIGVVVPNPGQIILSFKIVPYDAMRSDGKPRPFSPSYAYLVAHGVSTAGQEALRIPCEGNGFCAGYSTPPMMRTAVNVADGFTLAYQRVSGGLDVISQVRIPEPDKREYSACVMALAKSVAGRHR